MLEALDEREKDLVRRAMLAAADGPFFPDWEFQTLMGVTRGEMREAISAFPNLLKSNSVHLCSVNNALFMLTTYPIKNTEALAETGLDLSELAGLLKKLRRSLDRPTERFVDYME